jgi:hypothetical protein
MNKKLTSYRKTSINITVNYLKSFLFDYVPDTVKIKKFNAHGFMDTTAEIFKIQEFWTVKSFLVFLHGRRKHDCICGFNNARENRICDPCSLIFLAFLDLKFEGQRSATI